MGSLKKPPLVQRPNFDDAVSQKERKEKKYRHLYSTRIFVQAIIDNIKKKKREEDVDGVVGWVSGTNNIKFM